MRAFWKKYDIWISSVFFAALLCVIVFFVIMPMEKEIQTSEDNIQQKMEDDSLNLERIAKIPDMEKASVSFEENKSNLDIMLNGDNEVDFIKEMEALAQETGNKIDLKIEDNNRQTSTSATQVQNDSQGDTGASGNTAPSVKKDPNDILANLPYGKYLMFQISLEGDYASALEFIHKVENMNYYVNVISINMARGIDEASGGNTVRTDSAPSLFSSGDNSQGNDSQSLGVPVLKSTLEAIIYLHK